MRIRAFKTEDAAALAAIFHASVRMIGCKDYTQKQVEAWSPAPVSAEAFTARVSDGRTVLVAVSNEGEPIGFIELENDGHIDCFYCAPAVVGHGVGSGLYIRLEEIARTRGLPQLYVEASEAARRFFLGKGFSTVKRQDFERHGVRLHNYLMKKPLC